MDTNADADRRRSDAYRFPRTVCHQVGGKADKHSSRHHCPSHEKGRITHDNVRDPPAAPSPTHIQQCGGYTERIGAAAVTDTLSVEKRCQMSDDDVSTVYAAGHRGVEMGLGLIQDGLVPERANG